MTAAPIVVEVPGSRSDAINIMVRNGLTGLPVIRASDGKLMGVVSRRDVFRKFDEDQLSLVMKKGCITVTPDTPIEEAAAIFSSKRIHRLPVVEDGKLVGIVTPTDMLRLVKEMRTDLLAEDIIRTTCVTAYEDEPLTYTIPAMRISDVPALPVLDSQGKLVGILTDRDLFSDQVGTSSRCSTPRPTSTCRTTGRSRTSWSGTPTRSSRRRTYLRWLRSCSPTISDRSRFTGTRTSSWAWFMM